MHWPVDIAVDNCVDNSAADGPATIHFLFDSGDDGLNICGAPTGRISVSRETAVFFVTIAKNWSQIPSTGRFFGSAECRTSEIPILVGGTDSSFDIFLGSEQYGIVDLTTCARGGCS